MADLATLFAIFTPVIGVGVWTGTIQNQVSNHKEMLDKRQLDGERLARLESKIDLLVERIFNNGP